MGAYAMNLGLPGIAIHGTNKPHGIGLRSSHGCIRMYPEDIETLFNAVPTNTPVTIIDTSYKIGWAGNTMFLEVMLTQEQVDDISEHRQPERLDRPEIYDEIIKNAGTKEGIDWFAVENALIDHSGLPVAVFSK
jgi:L,D-transpeptidase ErfK/SrfK